MPPSSRGLGHLPFTEVTGIRIPLGVLNLLKTLTTLKLNGVGILISIVFSDYYFKPSTLPGLVNFYCQDPDLNWRHEDFQSTALPTELSRLSNSV